MSQLEVDKIIPQSGTTLTIGETGDTISFASGVLPSLESLTITGDLTVDTNTLYVDSTNNRVGVGTTSPASLLELEGTSTTAKIHIDSTSIGASSFDGSGAGLLLTAGGMNTTAKFTPAIQFGSTDPNFTTTNPKVGAAINAICAESFVADTDGAMDLAFYTTPSSPGTGQTTTERMRITSSGNVGIGTSSPSNKTHITSSVSGTTPVLRVENSNSDGLIGFKRTSGTPSDDYVLGADSTRMYFRNNTTSTDLISILEGGNVGIGTSSPAATFHVVGAMRQQRSGGNSFEWAISSGGNYFLTDITNAAERMRITSTGNVGIGTSSPTATLHVAGNALIGPNVNGSEAAPYISLDGAGYTGIHWLDANAYYIGQNSNSRSLRIYSGSNENAGAQLSAGGTSFGTYSDERLKKDITDLTNGLDKISAIRAVKFKYKTDADDYKTRIGIIAQSLVGQVDEALDLSRLNDTDTTEYYNVRYQDLIPVLVKGMQEQQTQIEELKARLETLENT